MADGVIRWEAPPAPGNRHGRYAVAIAHELIASQLRRRPGEWALIAENPSGGKLTSDINAGTLRAYRPAGSFESTTRNNDGRPCVYARYVGEATDAV